jgi:hypothetical protein
LFFTNKLQLQVSHILWCLPFKLVNCWHMCSIKYYIWVTFVSLIFLIYVTHIHVWFKPI